MACEVEPSCVSTTPLPALSTRTHTHPHYPPRGRFLHFSPLRAQIGYHDGPWCSVYGSAPELWNYTDTTLTRYIPDGQTNGWGGSSYPDDTGDIVHAIDATKPNIQYICLTPCGEPTSAPRVCSSKIAAPRPPLPPPLPSPRARPRALYAARRITRALMPRRHARGAHHDARGVLEGYRARAWQPLPLRWLWRLPRQRGPKRLCQ